MFGHPVGGRLFALLLTLAAIAPGERLALRIYTAADGLAHNSVNRIVRDSRGCLWFGTSEGLSRFDGYDFYTYGRRDGLPHRVVTDILETRQGDMWIATAGGVCKYSPKETGRKKFRVYRPGNNDRASNLNVLLEDSAGRIWCGTDLGLFRLEWRAGQSEPEFRSVDLGMPKEGWDDQVIYALLQDARGDLWAGAGSGLYRLRSSGEVQRYTESSGLPQNHITALLQDQQHRIWAGTYSGLCKLSSDPASAGKAVDAVYKEKDGLGSDSIEVLYQLADGTICAGTKMGLSTMAPKREAGSAAFTGYTAKDGLPASGVTSLEEDAADNLWIGTDGSGAAKLIWKSLVTYTADDGLRGSSIDSIFEDNAGKLCVVARQGSAEIYVNEFDGRRFSATRVNLPSGTRMPNWGPRSQSLAHDEKGNWWIGTTDGVLSYSRIGRIADLARARPTARYTERDGLSAGSVMSVFRDSEAKLWASVTGQHNGLFRFDAQGRTFHSFSEGLPWLGTSGVSLFAQDRPSHLWMGLLRFGKGKPEVARLSEGSKFERFGEVEDAPSGSIRALYLDRQRRLWVGTDQSGLVRFDHPEASHPAVTRYSTANGLSSDLILTITEDLSGRLYVGNGSGFDRLDVATGKIKKYTSADGLPAGEVRASFRDHEGVLWFGAAGGLFRLVPPPYRRPRAPHIAITSLRVGGMRQPISDLGETGISGLRYRPDQNNVDVGFTGAAFAPGEILKYQCMLEGGDSEWSPPSLQRSIQYANLSPHFYRFLVRAVDAEGVASLQPASMAFVILPPVWMRWWFQLMGLAFILAIVYGLHQYRVKRLLELERVRTRIATDLHDDIGSSLSQIAILSEVAQGQLDSALPRLAEPLTDIAGISRELVDSMSDIVWAIDPERDYLDDLVHRMRRFASDVFSTREMLLKFQPPAGKQDFEMGADLRRQVFLIFKEAVHNVLRHSRATQVDIALRVEYTRLNLTITDNGKGFDCRAGDSGHGLRSMSERARSVGGRVEIESGSEGSRVSLQVPVGRRKTRRQIKRTIRPTNPHK